MCVCGCFRFSTAARAKLIASTVESSVARAADSVAHKERRRRIAGREACNKLRERRKAEDAKRTAHIRDLQRAIAIRRSEVAASKNAVRAMKAEVEALTETIKSRLVVADDLLLSFFLFFSDSSYHAYPRTALLGREIITSSHRFRCCRHRMNQGRS